jgi:hypothetical protein
MRRLFSGAGEGPEPAQHRGCPCRCPNVLLHHSLPFAGSKHRAGADTPDHLAVTGCRWCARRRRSVADTVRDGADAIAGTDHGLAASGRRWSCGWCPAPSTSALLNHGGLIGVDQVARGGLIARLPQRDKPVKRDTWDAVIAAGRRWRDGGCGLLGCRATGQSANRGGEDCLFHHLCSHGSRSAGRPNQRRLSPSGEDHAF